MEINLDVLFLAIDSILNYTLFTCSIAFIIFFKLDFKALWKSKDFASNETLSSMTISIVINVVSFFLISFTINSIVSLDIEKNSSACLRYTLQSFMLLGYVYAHIKAHRLLNINMHALPKLCCFFGNILIYIHLIRFADRLVFETNLLSLAYRLSIVSINSLIVLTMIGSLIYLMIATQKLNRKEA